MSGIAAQYGLSVLRAQRAIGLAGCACDGAHVFVEADAACGHVDEVRPIGSRQAADASSHLCHEAGAELFIADVNSDNLKMTLDAVPAMVVPPSEILFADVDVLAPCALGNILTSSTIPNIKAKVIAGAANNQLSTPADGLRLAQRDVLYAPDYVINAGGIISVAHEYYGDASEDDVRADVGRIKDRLADLFRQAAETGRPTNELADELARKLVAEAR